jgi:hypothetical protein
MNADPGRGWTGGELAQHLKVPPRNMLTQVPSALVGSPFAG